VSVTTISGVPIATLPQQLIPNTAMPSTSVFRVPGGVLRGVMLAHALDLLRQMRVVQVKANVDVDGGYRQAQGWEPPAFGSLRETWELLAGAARRLGDEFPELIGVLDHIVEMFAMVLDPNADVRRLWNVYFGVVQQLGDRLGLITDAQHTCTFTAFPDELEVRLDLRHRLGPLPGHDDDARAVSRHLDAPEYLAAVEMLAAQARGARQHPSGSQLIAEQLAYAYLARGFRVPRPLRTWGTSGFRDHQTYMSVTDPGEGHLDGTTRETRYLDGVIVHIEHLERGRHQDRGEIEPYRMPHPQTVAKVRLILGSAAPSSSYVGRPTFEGAVGPSMLKAIHTIASSCSELFAEGLTECKLAIEGMTAAEAVRFMRAVNAAVRRDRFTQLLSAAFNLNTPIIDDRGGPGSTAVRGQLQLGLLGIELTRAGGFDKVTWDGTGDCYPSRCVLEQIPFTEALTLVHRAHEVGLLTYFSAGFRFHHVPLAVYTGVDGVGVGGAQILRYMDKDTGNHGPFIEENIARILAERDIAELSMRGLAAATLSRLDRMAFEGSITASENARRLELFSLLATETDQESLSRVLDTVAHVTSQPQDADLPLLCWARRLRAAGQDSIAARSFQPAEWTQQLASLTQAASRRDLDFLHEELFRVNERIDTTVGPPGMGVHHNG
jgi:hypothetical protein